MPAVRKGRELSAPGSFSARSEWTPTSLAGRLVELSGGEDTATLTCAFGLIRQAQLLGELVAWIGTVHETFYPPDVATGGVDLDALAVIRVPDGKGLAARNLVRAADQLARSGAFGLLVIDVGTAHVAMAALSRLLGLAQRHKLAILFLTDKPESAPSLGSLVSLRGRVQRTRRGEDEFLCTLEAIKDKKRAPGWQVTEVCGGPQGLH
jgi:recombination protein RecA